VDGRLVLRVEAEGLGEAAILGADHLAAGDEADEIVLHRLAAVLPGEGGGRLARAGESHDEERLLSGIGRDDLAAGVHGQPARGVDLGVPHFAGHPSSTRRNSRSS